MRKRVKALVASLGALLVQLAIVAPCWRNDSHISDNFVSSHKLRDGLTWSSQYSEVSGFPECGGDALLRSKLLRWLNMTHIFTRTGHVPRHGDTVDWWNRLNVQAPGQLV